MRRLLPLAVAASMLLVIPAKAQTCRGHSGWAALGFRQGVAMRWFQEHGRTFAPDYALKECTNNSECKEYLAQRCAYQ